MKCDFYLAKNLKFRIFFLLIAVCLGLYIYSDLFENGKFMGVEDANDFKGIFIFFFSLIGAFFPWHWVDKD
jgi:hypothetical protein